MSVTKNVLAALLLVSAGGAHAADSPWQIEAGLTSGYDSNPLRLPVNERGGTYMEGVAEVGRDLDLGDRLLFSFNAGAEHRAHGEGLADADETRGVLQASLELTPARNVWPPMSPHKSRWFVLTAGARLTARRDTFTSRATGDVFEVDDGSGTSVPIPERFDFNRLEAFFDGEWKPRHKTTVYLNTLYAAKDYVEDYGQIPTVESLDHTTLSFTPGVNFDATRRLEIEATLNRSSRDYATRTAVDGTGASVPGTRRQYVYTGYDVRFRVSPNRRWRFTLGLRGGDREDTYANYYDYTSLTGFAWWRVKIGDRSRLRMNISFRDRDYDRSTINDEADGELRSSETLRVSAGYTRSVAKRFAVTIEAGVQSVDNRNPIYAYDRQFYGFWIAYD